MNASELLGPYRPLMRDARHWEVTCLLLEWSLRHAFRRVEPALLAREAFVASAFEAYCCPPDATLEENLLGAKFIVCFLKADDGPSEELAAFLSPSEEHVSAPTELRACYDSWLEELHRLGRDTRSPQAAFRKMCECMRAERELERQAVTEAQYRELRQYIVAVPAYVACWTAIRALSPSERASEALERSGLLQVTAELVYTSNDLGSLERDEEAARQQPSGGDLNLVLLRARETGNLQEAVRQVMALYHERVRDFVRLRAQLADTEHWRERAVRDSVELLRGVANGNLTTTRELMATRYPGALPRLEGLPEVPPALAARPWDARVRRGV